MKGKLWDTLLAKAPSKDLEKKGAIEFRKIFKRKIFELLLVESSFFAFQPALHHTSCWRNKEHFDYPPKEKLS